MISTFNFVFCILIASIYCCTIESKSIVDYMNQIQKLKQNNYNRILRETIEKRLHQLINAIISIRLSRPTENRQTFSELTSALHVTKAKKENPVRIKLIEIMNGKDSIKVEHNYF